MDGLCSNIKAINAFQLRLMMGFLTEAVQRALSGAGFPLLPLLGTCFHEMPLLKMLLTY